MRKLLRMNKFTNDFGELVFFSGTATPIRVKRIRSLFCDHTYRRIQGTTGGGWMADIYKGKVCEKCGKWKDMRKVY